MAVKRQIGDKMKIVVITLALAAALMGASRVAGVEFQTCPSGTVLNPDSMGACMIDAPACRGGINEANQEDCSTDIQVQQ